MVSSMFMKRAVLLSASASALVWSGQAVAQTSASDTSQATTPDAPATAEIVVTARRKDERLQDVPVAISVVGSAQLVRTATVSFENVSTQLPQVMFTKALSVQGGNLTIRGVGSNTTGDSAIEQAVSFNIDGVSSARGPLINMALFDVSNVQILKGPQSLYFGKNSPAGVVVVKTNNPGKQLEGYITAGYEFKAREYRVEAAVGGPISDTFGLRVAGFHSDMSRGYVRNVAPAIKAADSPVYYDRTNGIDTPGASYQWGPGSRQSAIRATAVFEPTPEFTATGKFTFADYRDNGNTASIVATNCPVGSTIPLAIDLGAVFAGQANPVVPDSYGSCGTREQSVGALPGALAQRTPAWGDGKQYLKSRSYLGSLELGYRGEGFNITSITGLYKSNQKGLSTYELTTYALIPSFQRFGETIFSEEFRAATDSSRMFNFVLGGFYTHTTREGEEVDTLGRIPEPTSGSLNGWTVLSHTSGEALSAYGEVIGKLTPTLELDGGVRFTHETKNTVLKNTYVQNGAFGASGFTTPVGRLAGGRISEDSWTPQVTLTWKPSSEVTLYTGYRTGSKSGGISSPSLIPVVASPYDATVNNLRYGRERARGFEAGLKLDLDGGRLRGDVTIYDYTYLGLQIASFDAATNAMFIKNAGSATTTGIEGSVSYQATPELGLHVAAGYNRARYSSFPQAQCYAGQPVGPTACIDINNDGTGDFQNLTGRQLPRAPSVAASGGFLWNRPVSAGMGLEVGADVRYMSSYNTSAVLSPFANQKGFTTVDASVRLHDVDDRWSLSLIGRNLGNTYYATFTVDTPLAVAPGSQQGILGAPRTVTLQANYRF